MNKGAVHALLLLFLCIVTLVNAQSEEKRATCPGGGNCNGRGTCTDDGKCICKTGFAGDDCSYTITALTSGTILPSQKVARTQWMFYSINTTTGQGLRIQVNQTVIGGDADVYILRGTYPTRSNYDQKDTSTNTAMTLIVDDAGKNIWYIGIHGFLETTFSISAVVSGNLCADLNGCNGHGRCVAASQCSCNAGWSGADCSRAITTISLDNPVQGTLSRGEWIYYLLPLTSNNFLQFHVIETSSGGDIDLYLKFEAIPTMYSFDYKDISVQREFTLNITEPSLGNWYGGVYGFRNTSFTLTAKAGTSCPTRCSNHGTCSGSNCACKAGFSGISCENMRDDLTVGISQSGFVSNEAWNYYHIKPNTERNLQINVKQISGGDCDLYAKPGAVPTQTDYSARDIGTTSEFTLTISNPSDELWYLGVFGYSDCEYTITVVVNSVCPGNPACSGHGNCVAGLCVCSSGYNGVDCSQNGNHLANGISVSSHTLPDLGWEYYSFDVVNSTYLAIDLKEKGTSGFVWLYVSKGQVPTLRTYDYSSKDTNSKFHRLRISLGSAQTGTFQIGVYGNPFADRGPLSYSLAAWYTPF